MSFSTKIKDEIMSNPLKKSCCRRSLLHGIISAKAEAVNDAVVLKVENNDIAAYARSLIKEFFGRDAAVGSSEKGGRCKYLSFSSNSCERYLTDFLCGSGNGFIENCRFCRASYMRGVFLACGRMTEPQKQYCLEFSLENRADTFVSMFESMGLYMKIRTRGNENLLYTKNSSVIEDFFASADIQSAAFEVINTKIEKDFSNNANRARNLDTVNITRTVKTGNEQASAIAELEKRGLLTRLPEELLRTAKMRMEFPELSLAQLALKFVPPLTKSGLVHRMSKIMKLAKELL